MPTLEFKGKQFIYSHHLSVPFRELKVDAAKSQPAQGEKPSLDDNLIIHGDNLHALKALLPMYAGKVDCIFIDPPYSRGMIGPTLLALAKKRLSASNAIAVAEHHPADIIAPSLSGWELYDQRRYGMTQLSFLTLA